MFLDTKFQSILSLVLILSYVASDKLFSNTILFSNNSIAFGFVLPDNLRKLIFLGFASKIANALSFGLPDNIIQFIISGFFAISSSNNSIASVD